MKRITNLTAVVAISLGSVLSAKAITIGLGSPFTSDPSPAGTAPWLTATFTDVSGGVQLKIDAANLSGSEFASDIYFNLDVSTTGLTSSQQAKTGTFTDPTFAISGSGQWNKADGTGGHFDLVYSFDTSSGNTFGSGESVTFLLSGITGLTANDFNVLNTDGSPNYAAAAHIQSLSDGGSTWIGGGTDTRTNNVSVPDAGSTALLLGAALSGLGMMTRRIKK